MRDVRRNLFWTEGAWTDDEEEVVPDKGSLD